MTYQITRKSGQGDEAAWLRKRAAQCEPGSYLAALFNEDMLGWVESHIRQDLMPDLYAEMRICREEANTAGQLRLQLQSKEQTIQGLVDQREALRGEVATLQAKVARLEELEALNERLREQYHEANAARAEERRTSARMQQTLETIAARTTRAWLRSETILPEDLRDILGSGEIAFNVGPGAPES